MSDGIITPGAQIVKPSIIIEVSGNSGFNVSWKGLPEDPVILLGLLEIAKKMVMDQCGPKAEAPSPIAMPTMKIPPLRFPANGGHR